MRVIRSLLRRLSLAIVAAAPVALAQPPRADAGQPANPPPVLRAGDVIRLRIWREPDLSGDFAVDESGVVVFPKIGPYRISGESADVLKDTLVRAYTTYLRNPSVDVVLLRRVNILGAVRNPGLYTVDPTMTITDALALAGGITGEGKFDRVDLVRRGTVISTRLARGTRLGDTPVESGDHLYVPQRSWVSRNATLVAASLSAGVSLAIALFLRR